MVQQQLDGSFLPVISPSSHGPATVSNIEAWVCNNHSEVSKHLAVSGGILFRGFNVNTAEEFEKLGLAVNPSLATRYPGGAPREKLATHVWTASETPGHMPISSHCELSYIPNLRPQMIMFCCLDAAQVGGETPVANMQAAWKSLPKDLQGRIMSNDIEVVRQYPGSRRRMLDVRRLAAPTTAWHNVLGSKDPRVVEAEANKDGVTLTFWKGGKMPPIASVLQKQVNKGKLSSLEVLLHMPLAAILYLIRLLSKFCAWPLVEMQEACPQPDTSDSEVCVELVSSCKGYRDLPGGRAYGGVDVLFSEYGWAVESVFVLLRTRRLTDMYVAFCIITGTLVFSVLRRLGVIGRAPMDLRIQGRSLGLRDVICLNRAYWDNFTFLKWQAGDVLVLNNDLCSHGRMPFNGKRTVLTAFG